MNPAFSGGLQEAAIVFNLLPATYAHPSWFDVPAPLDERLATLQSPAARAAASDWLLTRYGAAARWDFDFAPLDKALFLLSPGELQKLAARIGVLRHRAVLRCAIGGGVLARLGGQLGATALQAILAGPPAPASLPLADEALDLDAPDLLPQLVEAGLPWLFAFLRPEWEAVTVRAQMKFPRSMLPQPKLTLEEDEREFGLAFLQTQLLAQEAA